MPNHVDHFLVRLISCHGQFCLGTHVGCEGEVVLGVLFFIVPMLPMVKPLGSAVAVREAKGARRD